MESLLAAAIEPVEGLPHSLRESMYSLYREYYDGTCRELFLTDLEDKDLALLLRDPAGCLRGFTTIKTISFRYQNRPHRAVYSGDTLIHHKFWGQQTLAFEWIRFAGTLKSKSPETPLYWLLLVKGHRTYRYLSAFCREFLPHWEENACLANRELRDHLGNTLFGEHFHPGTGVLHFPVSRGHLKPEWATVPGAAQQRADVRYFLDANPGYIQGDELVCLAELSRENLKPLAQRLFAGEGEC